MRIERLIYTVLIIACALFGAIHWRKAALFQADNELLRAKVEALEMEADPSSRTDEMVRTATEKLRSQTSELMKLRNEVTQLRDTAKSAEALASENQRLRSQNQQLQSNSARVAQSAQPMLENAGDGEQFPRNSWNFAGYATPEAALVSAIWAMREGDPKTYLDSLAPQEQQRVAQGWQNKSEAEIAAKHQSDVSTISGMRVLARNITSPSEMVMSVYLEGPERVEKVRMNQVGQEWKFGGFVTSGEQAAPGQ